MKVVGSPSIGQPDYWWFRARSELLEVVLADYAMRPGPILDVGSADGPSVGWLRSMAPTVALDLDRRGLTAGDVCGSVLALPFADESFGVVAAFDVVEHCDPEFQAFAEIARVLRPGGRALISVPAYQWAWTHFDEQNGHHRRYTRNRATAAVCQAGLRPLRTTHVFAGVFPFFAASRLWSRLREKGKVAPELAPGEPPPLPKVSRLVDRMMLGLSRVDAHLLRHWDMPFGSSIVIAAQKG